MNITASYLFLALAVLLGVIANSYAKSAEGFTLLTPSIITSISIILCMSTFCFSEFKSYLKSQSDP